MVMQMPTSTLDAHGGELREHETVLDVDRPASAELPRDLMLNARSSTIGTHSALRFAGIIRAKEIGAVSRENVAIFLRRKTPPFEPAVHWAFAQDLDATYDELKSSGANIVEPLEKKPWRLRQFTVEDLDGNRLYFHHD